MLRHGERECDELIIGITDVLLLPEGIRQAEQRGIWLKEHADIRKIYTYPLSVALRLGGGLP